jgi:drug/metabolite transporter (DMT)-like permease
MHDGLTVAVLAGLGGMLGWGLADFFAKKTIDVIGDLASLAWAHIFGTLGILIFGFYYYTHSHTLVLPHQAITWGTLAFFGVFQAIIYILVYQGFSKGQIAVLNPIFSSFSGITALLSLLFFKEIIGIRAAGSLLLIFLGVLFINLDIDSFKNKKITFLKVAGFKEIAFATIFAAFWTLFWDKVVGGQDWVVFSLVMYIFMTIYIWIICYIKKIKVFFNNSSMWKYLILIGICETLAYLSISLGYSVTTKTSIIAVLSGAFSLPTIFCARMFLKEKTSTFQTLGSLVIVFGVILLSVLK